MEEKIFFCFLKASILEVQVDILKTRVLEGFKYSQDNELIELIMDIMVIHSHNKLLK